MIVTFNEEYLRNLYTKGESLDKKYRFQPQIISKYIKIVNMMIQAKNVMTLRQFASLHYEKLIGDKQGLSSIRVNRQYRIEFEEYTEGEETIATICNITNLSNHYQ